MGKKQQKNYEIEINVGEIVTLLLKKIKWIILAGVLCASIAVVATKVFITPQYQSVTKMYVLAQQESDTLTTSDIQMSSYVAKDYVDLVKSRTVAENVIEKLHLEMSVEELWGKITVYTQPDTRIVTIVVTDEDPEHACELADTVREVSAEQIKNVMKSQTVTVVDKANVPTYPIGPNVRKNGMIGGAFGVCVTILGILIWYFANDTIRTADDMEKYLSISTLGVIPMSSTEKKKKKARRR